MLRKYLLIIPLLAIIFSACGNTPEIVEEPTERDIFLASLTRENFIYDVDYMLRVLEENPGRQADVQHFDV